MTSVIGSIYTAIESMSILVDGSAPKVYGLTGLPNTVASAMLPCRILLDLANAGEGQSMDFFSINTGIGGGGNQYVDWQLSDLMLMLPQAQGIGVKQVATTLVEYTGAYIDAARDNRAIVPTANITGLRVSPGIYQYPAEGGVSYWGCMATLTIREIIS